MRKISIIMLAGALWMVWAGLFAVGIGYLAESLPGLGRVKQFARYGDHAVIVTADNWLRTVDLSDREHPQFAGNLRITDELAELQALKIWQDNAYLFYSLRYAVVSLSDPVQPSILRWVEVEGACASQEIQNGILYLSAVDPDVYGYCSIRSYSLADPMEPRLLDSLSVESYYPDELVCGNGFLVCSRIYPWIVRTEDPSHLQYIGHIPDQDYWELATLAAEGNLLVTASNYDVSVYDLSQEPVLLARTPTQALRLTLRGGCISRGKFWCQYLDYNERIRFMGVDLSDPSQPGQVYTSAILSGWDSFWCDGQMLAAEFDAHDIRFADVPEAGEPVFDCAFPLYSIGYVAAQGDVLIGYNAGGRICLLDPQTDGSVQLDLSFEANYPGNLEIHRGLLLYSEHSEIGWWQRLTVRDAYTGELLSTVELEQAWPVYQILPSGDLVYICTDTDGWYIIDVGDPRQPVVLWHETGVGDYNCAALEGNKLWLASSAMLYCYDVSSPTSPQLLYESLLVIENSFIRPQKLLKRGDILYALGYDDIYCFELDDSGPHSVTDYHCRYVSGSMLGFGNGLLVGSTRGISVLSLQDPRHPQEVAWRDLEPTAAEAVGDCFTVQGNRIYAGDGRKLLTLDGSRALQLLEHPEKADLLYVYPNPAGSTAKIDFDLKTYGTARLDIYNLRGQKVASRLLPEIEAGFNTVEAELKDASGRALADGLYLLRIGCNGQTRYGKVVILN